MTRRRLTTLAILETANVFWFALVFFGLLGTPTTGANLAGFAVCSVLLIQGSAYWYLKLRQLDRGERLPAGMAVFGVLRVVNPILLLVSGAYIGWTLLNGVSWWTEVLLGIVLWVLAVLEQVNYFHVRLSYDNRADLSRLMRTRRLRRSHLARDLGRARRAPEPVGPRRP
ncbi:hypothetical protein ABZ620_00775 [Nocardiopsis alba]|uniref:hypothetical protein n=1 Tax=Nocardiopsis alba TaxID=53437 RepID=UPI0033DB985F